MSMERLQQVASRTDLSMIEFVVAIKLAYHENSKTGECFPSISALERETGLSRPSVIKAISGIESKQLITKEVKLDAKNNHHSLYKFTKRMDRTVVKEVNHGVVKEIYRGGKNDLPPVVNDVNPNKEYKSRRESGISSSPSTVDTVGGDDGPEKDAGDSQAVMQTGDPSPEPAADSASQRIDTHHAGSGKPDTKAARSKIKDPLLKWMRIAPAFTNPFDAVYENGGMFLPAYDPSSPGDILGCSLSQTAIESIAADPVRAALELTGEMKNAVTRRAIERRFRRIGAAHFVGEVARLLSERETGRSKCGNYGQILIRRLEYCYAIAIATDNFTRKPDWSLLWKHALGLLDRFAA